MNFVLSVGKILLRNKMKSIKTEEFFKLVAVNSGISDLDVIRRVFYGMIKTISRELRTNEIINLPDWGKFFLKTHKPKKVMNVNTGDHMVIKPTKLVKFIPDYKVKKYFHSLTE